MTKMLDPATLSPHFQTPSKHADIMAEEDEVSKHNAHTSTSLIGLCLSTSHPTLSARYRIEWVDSKGKTTNGWIPALRNLSIRAQDRVLVYFPANYPEPIIIGVLDGFDSNSKKTQENSSITLQEDEHISIVSSTGKTIAEISHYQGSPQISLFSKDIKLEFAGSLSLKAPSIDLESTKGNINLSSSDDIDMCAEIINLNS